MSGMELLGEQLKDLASIVRKGIDRHDSDGVPLVLAICAALPPAIIPKLTADDVVVWLDDDENRHALVAHGGLLVIAKAGAGSRSGTATVLRRTDVLSIEAQGIDPKSQYDHELDVRINKWVINFRSGDTIAIDTSTWREPRPSQAEGFVRGLLG